MDIRWQEDAEVRTGTRSCAAYHLTNDDLENLSGIEGRAGHHPPRGSKFAVLETAEKVACKCSTAFDQPSVDIAARRERRYDRRSINIGVGLKQTVGGDGSHKGDNNSGAYNDGAHSRYNQRAAPHSVIIKRRVGRTLKVGVS